jgi:hypothetical protein
MRPEPLLRRRGAFAPFSLGAAATRRYRLGDVEHSNRAGSDADLAE